MKLVLEFVCLWSFVSGAKFIFCMLFLVTHTWKPSLLQLETRHIVTWLKYSVMSERNKQWASLQINILAENSLWALTIKLTSISAWWWQLSLTHQWLQILKITCHFFSLLNWFTLILYQDYNQSLEYKHIKNGVKLELKCFSEFYWATAR